jgi:hypothetical protein
MTSIKEIATEKEQNKKEVEELNEALIKKTSKRSVTGSIGARPL